MYHVPLALKCIYGCSNERGENGDGEEGSESSGGGERVETVWPFVFCGESEEDLRAMLVRFVEV